MASVVDIPSRFEFGRVLQRSSAAIGRNGLIFVALAIIVLGVPSTVVAIFQKEAMAAGASSTFFLWALASGLLSFLLGSILQVAIIRATILDLRGVKASLGSCLQTGLNVLLPLIGMVIIMTLGLGLGMLLLIVPGIILYVMWSVALPVLVEERAGVFGSLGRSRELTKGVRWSIFGLILLYAVALIVIGLLQFLVRGAVGGNIFVETILFNGIVIPVLMMWWSAVSASIYIELRDTKEGIAPERLADIFA